MGKIIDPALCVKCKGKNLCGKPCYFVEALKLKERATQIKERDELYTPPSVFVGRFGYPAVNVGALGVKDNSPEYYDAPRLWFTQKLDVASVLAKRLSMINPAFKTSVKTPSKLVEMVHEIAMARRSVLTEVEFMKKPSIEVNFSYVFSPVGLRGKLKRMVLAENPKVDRRVEKAYYDSDLKATDALVELYVRGVDENVLSRVLSVGMLGVKKQRKLVPTRWSITAVDDMLGKHFINEIRQYDVVDSVMIHYAEYNGNRFWVLLFPSTWKFELVEIAHPIGEWKKFGKRYYITKDYEDFTSRKKYVDETAGGYYASRLAVLEHLAKIKRQASVLIVREILPDYWAPLGVWVVRETVREAMRTKPRIMESVEQAIKIVENEMKCNLHLKSISKLLNKLKERQTTLVAWKK